MAIPDYQPVKQVKISTLIVEQIKSNIIEGNLKPGDPLPSERDLMKFFNVSRPSLREALKILDTMGFVVISQRKRTRVKSMAPEGFVEPIRTLLKEDMDTVIEVLDVRRCLESWNAYYAAERATEKDIERLGKTLESMEAKIDKNQSLVDEDAAFHLAISMAAHNKIQSHLMYSIYSLIQDTVGICYEMNESLDILEEHQNVYTAIKERDQKLAGQAMNFHLDNVLTRIKYFFENKTGSLMGFDADKTAGL